MGNSAASEGTEDAEHVSAATSRILATFPELELTGGITKEARDRMFPFALSSMESMSTWYRRKKEVKKAWCHGIRVGAALLIVAGIVCGILRHVHGFSLSEYGYIFFGLAGVLYVVDAWFGFSKDWVRFMMVSLAIEENINDFAFAWKGAELVGKEGNDDNDGAKYLALVKEYVDRCYGLMMAETKEWSDMFTNQRSAAENILKGGGG